MASDGSGRRLADGLYRAERRPECSLPAPREGNEGIPVQPPAAMKAEALGVKAEPQQPVAVGAPPEKEAEQQRRRQQDPGDGEQHPPEGAGGKEQQKGRKTHQFCRNGPVGKQVEKNPQGFQLHARALPFGFSLSYTTARPGDTMPLQNSGKGLEK